MKHFIMTFLLHLFLMKTFAQWSEHQLPVQCDVWGLENKDSIIYAGGEIGFQGPGYVFRSTDFGMNWEILNGLPYAGGWSLEFSDSVLTAGSFGWGLFLSEDLGSGWTVPDSGMASNENVHVIIKHKSYLFAATGGLGNGIFRSSDDGHSWIPVNNGLQTLSFLSLASNGEYLYAGTSFTGEVYRSANDGMEWFLISSGLPVNSMIASLAASDSNVYAGLGSGEGVYFSNNYGDYWTKISASISLGQVWVLELVDSNLFVGSIGNGIFLTQNNGVSWNAANEGLNHLNTRSLLVTDTDYLIAGTTDGFIYSRQISQMTTDIKKEKYLPLSFKLFENYPNPFNPTTKISWQSPFSSWQTLKVYDILGNKVATLVDEFKPAGSYEAEFDASGLPSGVYFYQLTAGGSTQTKKMLLLK